MITEETISRVKSSLQATKSFLALEVIERLEKEHSLLNDIIESFTSQSLTDDFEMANTAREIAEILGIKNYR